MTQSHNDGLILGADGKRRCFWSGKDGLYQDYHDREWGKPVYDDRKLFEKICLESFQSGLSWYIILKKREAFRRAFDDFIFDKVARYDEKKVALLLDDKSIIRHKGKILAVINNARCAQELVAQKGSLSEYFWSFMPPLSERPAKVDLAHYAAATKTPTSIALAQDLKKRGWQFVGPTTAYAFMQAMGIVNDHLSGCDFR